MRAAVCRLPRFEYLAPRTIEEACSLLEKHDGKARVMAGGTDLLLKMKVRDAVPQYLIGLKSIPHLNYVQHDEVEGLKIGALVSLNTIYFSPVIRENFRVLSEAASHMASTQIRNLGTIGGNLCNGAPSADTAPPLIALNAEVKLVSPSGERVVALEEFFTGPDETVLRPAELLTEICVPNLPPGSGGAFLKHTLRSAMDLAIVNAAAVVTLDSMRKRCVDARIALGVAAPTVIRVRKTEALLRGETISNEIIEKVAQAASTEAHPRTSVRATAEYRREIIKVLTKRALRQAWERAVAA